MNLPNIAKAAGSIFILVGILGFIPALTPNGHLLGLFHVNAAHNIVHILSGAAALACGAAGYTATRTYFQVFGIIYLLVAIIGLFIGEGLVLGIIANNGHDVWLHFLIAAGSLYLGFGYRGLVTVSHPL